jgi:hypothetical protein
MQDLSKICKKYTLEPVIPMPRDVLLIAHHIRIGRIVRSILRRTSRLCARSVGVEIEEGSTCLLVGHMNPFILRTLQVFLSIDHHRHLKVVCLGISLSKFLVLRRAFGFYHLGVGGHIGGDELDQCPGMLIDCGEDLDLYGKVRVRLSMDFYDACKSRLGPSMAGPKSASVC